MMKDETFFAWLDGELSPEDAARVEAAVARDPRLGERARQHRAMQARLKAPFDAMLDTPVPGHLVTALRNPPEADVIDLAQAKRRREARAWPRVAQWGAMAATLAVGILIGTVVPEQRNRLPVEMQGSRMYAASNLDHALETQLASAPGRDTRIGLTFRDRSGAVCRTFTATASSGLACREQGRWQVLGLFAAPEGQGEAYRMAAGMDPNLAALVDSVMTGEPLDGAGERAARQRGWE